MTLRPIDFGSETMPGGAILWHGINNTGKTVLLAAALKYFSQFGKVTMASLDEEQGHSSAAGMGLEKAALGYQCLYAIDSIDEYIEWLEMIEKAKGEYIACGVDSLWAKYRLIQKKKTGGTRPPKAGQSSDNEWPWIHNDAHNLMTRWRKSCRWNFMTCPSDTGQSALKEVESGIKSKDLMVVPDLNGKMATGCVHWFNLLGYLMCDQVKQGTKVTVKRSLDFRPSARYLTRQRMPFSGGSTITSLIEVPENNPIAAIEELMRQADESFSKAYHKINNNKETK